MAISRPQETAGSFTAILPQLMRQSFTPEQWQNAHKT
jgi:hypothetical protein